MSKAILVLVRPFDANIATQAIKLDKRHDIEIFTLSPSVANALAEIHDLNVNHISVPSSFRSDYQKFTAEIDYSAREFDRQAALLRKKHLGIDASHLGWDYLNVRAIIQTFVETVCYGKFLRESIQNTCHIYLPWCVNSSDYYFDSANLRSLILKELKKISPSITKLNFGFGRNYIESAYDYLPDNLEREVEYLVHLPTANYSRKSHIERLKKLGCLALDLQSPYFDVSVCEERICLDAPLAASNINGAYSEKYWALFKDLARCFELDVTNDMCRRLLKRSSFQVNSFYRFMSSSALKDAKKIDITDHDAGLQGPLMAFARERDIAVDVWPHSTVCHMPFPSSGRTIKRLTKGIDSAYMRLTAVSAECRDNIRTGEPIIFGRVRRALLLHNELESGGGLAVINFSELEVLYKGIKSFFFKNLIEFKVRHKTKHAYSVILGDDSSVLAKGDIDSWYSWPDLCIGFGVPTSALYGFLNAGCFCVHFSIGPITEAEAGILPDGVRLIGCESAADCLNELSVLCGINSTGS